MRCKHAGGTVALMGKYSVQQSELLEKLRKLRRPMAGALGPGVKPPGLHAEDAAARKQMREELKKRYGMSDAEIDYAIESLNDYDDT